MHQCPPICEVIARITSSTEDIRGLRLLNQLGCSAINHDQSPVDKPMVLNGTSAVGSVKVHDIHLVLVGWFEVLLKLSNLEL